MGSVSQTIGSGLQIAGGLGQMYGSRLAAQGQIKTATATAESDLFNAGVDANNASILTHNATEAGQAGDANAGISEQKTGQQVAAIKANQAASGVDVNSGSAVGVRNSASATGMLDALTIRSNAAKQAYGFLTEAASSTAQSKLDKSKAAFDISAGNAEAQATILGGAAKAASSFGNYLMTSSLNPTKEPAPVGQSVSTDSHGIVWNN